jgi:hypothetical protein
MAGHQELHRSPMVARAGDVKFVDVDGKVVTATEAEDVRQ